MENVICDRAGGMFCASDSFGHCEHNIPHTRKGVHNNGGLCCTVGRTCTSWPDGTISSVRCVEFDGPKREAEGWKVKRHPDGWAVKRGPNE